MQVQERELPPPASKSSPSTYLVNDPSALHLPLMEAAVLPEQFYRTPTSAGHSRGVANLMLAVIEDALKCFCRQFSSHSRRDQRLAREAEAWFFDTDGDYLFSFEQICQVLEFDPSALRGQLRQWRQQQSTSFGPEKKAPSKTGKSAFSTRRLKIREEAGKICRLSTF